MWFFSEAQSILVKYCNIQIKLGYMCTELVYTDLKTKIIPHCYANLILEAGEVNHQYMPSYEELTPMLDINELGYTTVWMWLQDIGYNYDENKRSYHTGGHKREDVVKDYNEKFLVYYFTIERRAYRWVQLLFDDAVLLEKNEYWFPRWKWKAIINLRSRLEYLTSTGIH